MSWKPLVSVIVPTYNCADLIGEALESALSQTYERYEIIVVDDGSTDGTRTVLAPYRDKIKYIYQDNRGLPSARNTAIRHSRGEVLALLDADDIWFPMKLALQVEALVAHPQAGLAFADFLDFEESGVTRSSRLQTHKHARVWFENNRIRETEFACGPMYEDLFQSNWIHASSAVVKRDVLDDVGWFDEVLLKGEDFDLWLRITQRYPVVCVNRVLSGYRYRAESLCGPVDKRAFEHHHIIRKVLEKHLRNHLVPSALVSTVKMRLRERYWALGWNLFGEDRFSEARGFFWDGIRYRPFDGQLWAYWLGSFLPLTSIEVLRRFRRWRRGEPLHPEVCRR